MPFLLRVLVDALGEGRIAPTADNAGQVETRNAVNDRISVFGNAGRDSVVVPIRMGYAR